MLCYTVLWTHDNCNNTYSYKALFCALKWWHAWHNYSSALLSCIWPTVGVMAWSSIQERVLSFFWPMLIKGSVAFAGWGFSMLGNVHCLRSILVSPPKGTKATKCIVSKSIPWVFEKGWRSAHGSGWRWGKWKAHLWLYRREIDGGFSTLC